MAGHAQTAAAALAGTFYTFVQSLSTRVFKLKNPVPGELRARTREVQ
jgi:hypothetical protein